MFKSVDIADLSKEDLGVSNEYFSLYGIVQRAFLGLPLKKRDAVTESGNLIAHAESNYKQAEQQPLRSANARLTNFLSQYVLLFIIYINFFKYTKLLT